MKQFSILMTAVSLLTTGFVSANSCECDPCVCTMEKNCGCQAELNNEVSSLSEVSASSACANNEKCPCPGQ